MVFHWPDVDGGNQLLMLLYRKPELVTLVQPVLVTILAAEAAAAASAAVVVQPALGMETLQLVIRTTRPMDLSRLTQVMEAWITATIFPAISNFLARNFKNHIFYLAENNKIKVATTKFF
jgi:hypothetical protein